jgi:hypothetical protein
VQKAADNHAALCKTQTSSVVGDNTNNGSPPKLTKFSKLRKFYTAKAAFTLLTKSAIISGDFRILSCPVPS